MWKGFARIYEFSSLSKVPTFIDNKLTKWYHINDIIKAVTIYVAKKIMHTKAVETSAFVLSQMCFSQHINKGKCFVLFWINVSCLVQNI